VSYRLSEVPYRETPAGRALEIREKDIQRTICDLLRAEGWRVFEFEQQWSEKKRKTVGERGMPDVLAIRYRAAVSHVPTGPLSSREMYTDIVLWVELKRISRGRATKAELHQLAWHEAERARGALTLIAGVDFPATIEGFRAWYAQSGLARTGTSR